MNQQNLNKIRDTEKRPEKVKILMTSDEWSDEYCYM